jgi:hypothetical protein
MSLGVISLSDLSARPGDFHLLTFAETGFSPLTMFGRSCGLEDEELVKFADAVNAAGRVMTLHAKAPISAMPRAHVREVRAADVYRAVEDFMAMNAATIRARSIAIALCTPDVAPALRKAVEDALSPYARFEAVIVVV